MLRIDTQSQRLPLHSAQDTREIERDAYRDDAPDGLIERGGWACARLAAAIAPHARQTVVFVGPGNNGADGLYAAAALAQQGRQVRAVLPGGLPTLTTSSSLGRALAYAQSLGVPLVSASSAAVDPQDLVIDALFGLGLTRPLADAFAQAVAGINAHPGLRLAVDLPSGLDASAASPGGSGAVRATHTLSLLTLKPALFTGTGRDHGGELWWDNLGVSATGPPQAWLLGHDDAHLPERQHAQHKGSFGDLIVIGGDRGMGGAARLAAGAALAAGAGRVYLCPLSADSAQGLRAEVMPRDLAFAQDPQVLRASTVVAGCGGGAAMAALLPALLAHAHRLLLDADALNAVAADPALQRQLRARGARGQVTVLTPHPLEAARLLSTSVESVQADRLASAVALAQGVDAVVVLKGAGSVIACADGLPVICGRGGPALASGGTGDVLAGWLGGTWVQESAGCNETQAALRSAERAVWGHAVAGEAGGSFLPTPAQDLITAMQRMAGAGSAPFARARRLLGAAPPG